MQIKQKNLFLIAFIIMVLAQLSVPGKMIFTEHMVIKHGISYKFETEILYSGSWERMEHITLNFKIQQYESETEGQFEAGDKVYVTIGKGDMGFAEIKKITKKQPSENNYIEANVTYSSFDGSNYLLLDFPFDKYKYKAANYKKFETIWKISASEGALNYAEVKIKDGKAVLTDLFIDRISVNNIESHRSYIKNQ